MNAFLCRLCAGLNCVAQDGKDYIECHLLASIGVTNSIAFFISSVKSFLDKLNQIAVQSISCSPSGR